MVNHRIILSPFDAKTQTVVLQKWLHLAHVACWWLDPQAQLESCLERPAGGDHALICADDSAVGYLRWEPIRPALLVQHEVYEIPSNSVDLDIFIGEVDYLGKGIGPKALDLLATRIADETDAAYLALATSQHNHRAIRAYEKLWFKLVKNFDDDRYGPAQLMALALHRGDSQPSAATHRSHDTERLKV
jgi:aminoglycoside 6'-N-acetyltransferase